MANDALDALVTLHKALAHPVRLRIAAMLRGGELCVCQVRAALPLAASTVSEHLSELKAAGLVVERKAGRFVHYGLAPGAEARLALIWRDLETDAQVRADQRLADRLRRTPLDVICQPDFDSARLAQGRRVRRVER